MPSSELVAKVKKYMEQLKREEKIKKALSRLEKVDMTLDLLQKTAVGKAVNQLCSHDTYGDDALRIVTRWKEIARRNGIEMPKPVKQESDDEDGSEESDSERRRKEVHSSSGRKRYSPSPSPPPRKAIKVEVKEEADSPPPSPKQAVKPLKVKAKYVKKEVDDFSRMLSTADTAPARPKKPKSMEWNKDIDLNYRPLPLLPTTKPATSKEPGDDEEVVNFNPELMFKPRNDRLKVFAGRKKTATLTEVPTLFNFCMRFIMNNIDAIEDTGDIPYDILKPVLEKCTAKQLAYIEGRNPYLEEDSDELWQKFFEKQHPNKRLGHDETYKEAFFRIQNESEERLKMLTKKISSSHRAEEDKGQRKTMIADATAPREVRRRQQKYGLAYSKAPLPTASEVSKARKQIFESGSSRQLAAIPTAVVNRTSTVGAHKNSKKPIVKKGALMLKTMKMLNMKRR